GGG
ncbi:hypothetical protein CFC21_107933, partial [Triticum aestivum]